LFYSCKETKKQNADTKIVSCDSIIYHITPECEKVLYLKLDSTDWSNATHIEYDDNDNDIHWRIYIKRQESKINNRFLKKNNRYFAIKHYRIPVLFTIDYVFSDAKSYDIVFETHPRTLRFTTDFQGNITNMYIYPDEYDSQVFDKEQK